MIGKIFARLFGDTIEEQMTFLQKRTIVTTVLLVLLAITGLFSAIGVQNVVSALGAIAVYGLALMALIVWGWPVLKRLFGVASVSALISRNVVVGVAIFVVYLFVSYVLGITLAIVGTLRYYYLLYKEKKKKNTESIS